MVMTRRVVVLAFLLTLFQGPFGAQLNLDKLGPAVGDTRPRLRGSR